MSISGVGGAGAPQVWSGASPAMSPSQKMANLFDKMDNSGNGSITKNQFEQAFQTMNPPANVKSTGADTIFKLLDPHSSGQVSKTDFITSMTQILEQLNGQMSGSANGSASQTLTSGLNGLNSIKQDNDGDKDSSNLLLGANVNLKA